MQTLPVTLVQRGDTVSIMGSEPFVVTNVRPHHTDDKVTIYRDNGQQYSLYRSSSVSWVTPDDTDTVSTDDEPVF